MLKVTYPSSALQDLRSKEPDAAQAAKALLAQAREASLDRKAAQ